MAPNDALVALVGRMTVAALARAAEHPAKAATAEHMHMQMRHVLHTVLAVNTDFRF